MIVIRRYEEGNPDGVYLDLTSSQTEVVTDQSILKFLGRKGICEELRGINNIFNKEEEFVSVMSQELESGCSEIYFSSENGDDRFTICFSGDKIARLYGLMQSAAFLAVDYVAEYIIDNVVTDKEYFKVIDPLDVGIMILLMYCCVEEDGWVYEPTVFRKRLDKVLSAVRENEKYVADMTNPVEYICKLF